ncbi:hypothetical protein SLEP1_g7387 [Rubroshorea leprosula]|uniref:Uncharacterized protein n=1 Tax=Rubroshorea leprosula TaxID=152421 RepID=A0AAV5I7Z9_9ROSI|nr:hypothetical protein SLEP1_g7387 [Rubroshorea leprosula]
MQPQPVNQKSCCKTIVQPALDINLKPLLQPSTSEKFSHSWLKISIGSMIYQKDRDDGGA